MAWSAISCSLRSDPRLFVIDRRSAFAAVCAAYLFSSEHETDGLVPRAVLEEFAPAIVVDQLIRDGVLTDVGGDVEVVAFLDTNPTHAAREMMREKDRAKKRAVRCPRGTPDGTHQGIPKGTPSVRPPATGQDNTTQHSTLISAPSERPETAAPEPPGKRGRGGKGKTRRANPDATAAHLRAPTKPTESQRAWNHYRDRFERATGAKPTPLAHYFIALDRLVREHGADEIIRRVDVYFDAPPFSLRDGGRDFGLFLKCFDRLAARSSPAATHSSATPNGLLSDPNSFMRIGKVAGPNGEMIDAIPRLFPPHPRDERGGLSAPDAEGR